MNPQFEELKQRLTTINDLEAASAVLMWDQSTYMPPGGAAARGRQIATLGHLAHERFTDAAIGNLLDQLQPVVADLPAHSDDRALVEVTRYDYDKATRVPPEFMAQLYSHVAESYDVWAKARPVNDWTSVQPYLEKTLELSRQYADYFAPYDHIADPLIDMADQGMTVATVRDLFSQLRDQLVPMVQTMMAQAPADDSCLHQHYPEDQQQAFGEHLIRHIGYDFERGRQDKTLHPFMTRFSSGDIRITTRFKPNDLSDGLFSTIHETGHALYEQGVNRDYEATPLASGASAGVHESQSRLWENIVGRSRAFWHWAYPQLQQVFPQQLGSTDLDTFYRAINKVQRSLIRTDADELTYNLHVMLRFELELQLLEGTLAVRDLPEAWNARYQADLGITPPNHCDGVLQDVHWYAGIIGGVFQGYTLGNILSAQFFESAVKAHPAIPDQIAQGEFSPLLGWLRQNLYRYGRKYKVPDLIERASGQPLTIEPYMRYLRTKYGELYPGQ